MGFHEGSRMNAFFYGPGCMFFPIGQDEEVFDRHSVGMSVVLFLKCYLCRKCLKHNWLQPVHELTLGGRTRRLFVPLRWLAIYVFL